jgi:hypothetical protein
MSSTYGLRTFTVNGMPFVEAPLNLNAQHPLVPSTSVSSKCVAQYAKLPSFKPVTESSVSLATHTPIRFNDDNTFSMLDTDTAWPELKDKLQECHYFCYIVNGIYGAFINPKLTAFSGDSIHAAIAILDSSTRGRLRTQASVFLAYSAPALALAMLQHGKISVDDIGHLHLDSSLYHIEYEARHLRLQFTRVGGELGFPSSARNMIFSAHYSLSRHHSALQPPIDDITAEAIVVDEGGMELERLGTRRYKIETQKILLPSQEEMLGDGFDLRKYIVKTVTENKQFFAGLFIPCAISPEAEEKSLWDMLWSQAQVAAPGTIARTIHDYFYETFVTLRNWKADPLWDENDLAQVHRRIVSNAGILQHVSNPERFQDNVSELLLSIKSAAKTSGFRDSPISEFLITRRTRKTVPHLHLFHKCFPGHIRTATFYKFVIKMMAMCAIVPDNLQNVVEQSFADFVTPLSRGTLLMATDADILHARLVVLANHTDPPPGTPGYYKTHPTATFSAVAKATRDPSQLNASKCHLTQIKALASAYFVSSITVLKMSGPLQYEVQPHFVPVGGVPLYRRVQHDEPLTPSAATVAAAAPDAVSKKRKRELGKSTGHRKKLGKKEADDDDDMGIDGLDDEEGLMEMDEPFFYIQFNCSDTVFEIPRAAVLHHSLAHSAIPGLFNMKEGFASIKTSADKPHKIVSISHTTFMFVFSVAVGSTVPFICSTLSMEDAARLVQETDFVGHQASHQVALYLLVQKGGLGALTQEMLDKYLLSLTVKVYSNADVSGGGNPPMISPRTPVAFVTAYWTICKQLRHQVYALPGLFHQCFGHVMAVVTQPNMAWSFTTARARVEKDAEVPNEPFDSSGIQSELAKLPKVNPLADAVMDSIVNAVSDGKINTKKPMDSITFYGQVLHLAPSNTSHLVPATWMADTVTSGRSPARLALATLRAFAFSPRACDLLGHLSYCALVVNDTNTMTHAFSTMLLHPSVALTNKMTKARLYSMRYGTVSGFYSKSAPANSVRKCIEHAVLITENVVQYFVQMDLMASRNDVQGLVETVMSEMMVQE